MTSETDRPQKITFADMRDMGVRGLLIYCSDYKCSHLITVSGSMAGEPGHRYPPDTSWVDMAMDGRILPVERRHRSPVAGMGTPCRIHHRFWSATSLLLHRSELTSHRESWSDRPFRIPMRHQRPKAPSQHLEPRGYSLGPLQSELPEVALAEPSRKGPSKIECSIHSRAASLN